MVKPQSAKSKGRRLQQFVRDRLIEKLGVDAEDVESRSMGAGGEDLIMAKAARKLFPFSIECKNQESLSIWSSMKQCEKNAGNFEPLLIFKRNHSKVYATLELEGLLTILKQLNALKDSNKTRVREEVQKNKISRRKMPKMRNRKAL